MLEDALIIAPALRGQEFMMKTFPSDCISFLFLHCSEVQRGWLCPQTCPSGPARLAQLGSARGFLHRLTRVQTLRGPFPAGTPEPSVLHRFKGCCGWHPSGLDPKVVKALWWRKKNRDSFYLGFRVFFLNKECLVSTNINIILTI